MRITMKNIVSGVAAGTLSLCLSPAMAQSIEGDQFTVRVFDNGTEVDSGSGTALSSGIDVNLLGFLDLRLDWEDDNTFELDFFGSTSDHLVITVEDLDFTAAGFPQGMTGVTELSNEFGLAYTLDFNANSITFDFGEVDDFEAADGEIARFRVDSDFYVCDGDGGGVTGDLFSVTIVESGETQSFGIGRAGADGIDVNLTNFLNFRMEWIDCDTFELDFYSTVGSVDDLVIYVEGLDFHQGGVATPITGVTEVSSEFGWDYTVDVTDTTIEIDYNALDPIQAADGEIIRFDVNTPAPCNGDIDGNGTVGTSDLIALLASWGVCETGDHPADLNDDGSVDTSDLIALLAAWGPC